MFDDLLAANRRYASKFALKGMTARAARGFGLVTCMDSRIDPLAMLGIGPGDAKILRTAGARVTADVLRSLVLATSFLGVTDIAIIHHTGCALGETTDDEILRDLPEEQRRHLEGTAFLAMPDPDAALAEDVRAVRSHRGLPSGIRVEG
ncbi:MAG TPA: carbonic anhydrase, partial [Acidimicrobiales bacterium]|nr:carbonic anhydrase [Acidimicrobiales bacterium]